MEKDDLFGVFYLAFLTAFWRGARSEIQIIDAPDYELWQQGRFYSAMNC